MARENAVFDVKIDAAANTVTFKVVGNGNTHVLHMEKVHSANVAYAALHGMKQRCVDNSALNRADKDGKVRSPEEQARLREEALVAMIEHYESGVERWNLREPGAGGTKKPTIDVDIVIRAAVAVKGGSVSYADMRAYLQRRATTAGCGLDAIAASLANDPKVAAAIAEIRQAEADTSLIDGWEDEFAEGGNETTTE